MQQRARICLPPPAVGSGEYRYRLNGEPTGVEETFEVADGPRGSSWSERRATGGVVLRVETEHDDAHNARCRLRFRSDQVDPVAVDYVLTDGRLSTNRNPGRPDVTDGTALQVDGDAVLSPLLRVFQGPAISATIRSGGELEAVVPALDPTDPATLLHPTVQLRSAERRGIEANPSDFDRPLRRCHYLGGNYDDTSEFWLDDRDRLVRYRFPQAPGQLWEVDLVSERTR